MSDVGVASPARLAAADYCRLREKVRGAGLLDYRPRYYAAKVVGTVAAFAAGWAVFAVVGNSWLVLLVAVLLAVLSTQVVFLGHDAGHREVSGSCRVNQRLGLFVANALTGLSFGWWVPKHSAHHAHPNQLGRDPDLGTGLVAFTVTSGTVTSGSAPEAGSGPTEVAPGQALVRLRERFQAPLFVVVLMLQGLGLHVTSVQSVLRRRDRMAVVERRLLVGNVLVYLAAVFWVLSPVKALAFIAVEQGLFGLYLGFTFAPNHKGMPVIAHDATVDFAERQVVTARNVTGGWITTVLLGGLNYQIEHHLFPTMPRPNLVRAQPFVRAFCAEQGLPYREERPLASYRQALRHLRPDDDGRYPVPAAGPDPAP